jgi:hypothetical protein
MNIARRFWWELAGKPLSLCSARFAVPFAAVVACIGANWLKGTATA